MTRVPPVVLLRAVAANADRSPVAHHHRLARMILAYGGGLLTDMERVFLHRCERRVCLSGPDFAHLREIESKVELGRFV